MSATSGGAADVAEDRHYGEIISDLDVRALRAKACVTVEPLDEGDGNDRSAELLEVLIGDGDSAITVTTSWANQLDEAAANVEAVGRELLRFADLLRERAARRRRPTPVATHFQLGVTPTS